MKRWSIDELRELAKEAPKRKGKEAMPAAFAGLYKRMKWRAPDVPLTAAEEEDNLRKALLKSLEAPDLLGVEPGAGPSQAPEVETPTMGPSGGLAAAASGSSKDPDFMSQSGHGLTHLSSLMVERSAELRSLADLFRERASRAEEAFAAAELARRRAESELGSAQLQASEGLTAITPLLEKVSAYQEEVEGLIARLGAEEAKCAAAEAEVAALREEIRRARGSQELLQRSAIDAVSYFKSGYNDCLERIAELYPDLDVSKLTYAKVFGDGA